jgi:type III pantothenate kinase
MMLLVDIGNSRVKWATLDNGRLGEQQAAAYEGWSVQEWRRALFDRPGIERVLAASVAGGPVAETLARAAEIETRSPVRFVAGERETAGVRSGYADHRLLGVDRWLAVVAAYRSVRGACCVADIGTAATFDAVTGGGQHLGGFIVPGPALMMRSLWRGTADLAERTASSGTAAEAPLADNTRDAIERGCLLAVAAFVDRGVAEVRRRLGIEPTLLLTGGGAAVLRPLIGTRCEEVPDLVLRGLAAVAEAAPGPGV